MKVSIVIPNYNGDKYLRECIDSIVGQGYQDYEIIVIDNDSEDSDYIWLKEYDNVLFKRLDKNYGFSRAVNEGIYRARGEYVLLLNNDTVAEESFIQNLVEAIEEDSKIFAVSSKMINYHDKSIIDDAGDEYTLLGWTLKRGDGRSVKEYTKSCKVFSACAGAALYRKEIFDKIGVFDESFFAYMEDVDISYRARIAGYYNVYCPKAKVYHIGSATSGSKYNAFKVRLAARNNLYVAYKNMPFPQLVINMPFLLVGWIIKYLFFLRKGLGKAYKEGLKDGILTLNRVNKVKFKWGNIKYYLHIEGLLIRNLLEYIICINYRKG